MPMQCASTTTKAKRASTTCNEFDSGTRATVRASDVVKSASDALKGKRGNHD